MLLFHNTQSLIKLNKLSTAKTIKAMLMSIGYEDWYVSYFKLIIGI